MAGEAQDSQWPLPKFYFLVDWGGMTNIPFQEVSGLEMDAEADAYRHGRSAVFSQFSMPGMLKNGHVTMKRGVFRKDNDFFDWFTKVKMNTIERQNIVVKLLDEGSTPTTKWTLINAWPTKISATDLNTAGNEVAIESIEIAHEGISIENA